MSTREHTDLERELRAAARSFDQVPVAGDAWQQNHRRIAADRGRRGRTVLGAAAVVVLVALVGAAVLLGGGSGPNRGTPSEGGDDPFGDSVILGPPVEVESLQLDRVQTSHEAVLSDTTGKGPSLCDRYVGGTGSSGSCTSRDPGADDPGVAFDWLTGSEGSGDIRGVLAGVDDRVMKVQIWMSNGDMTLATLKPGGWEGTQLFGFTVPADGPRPQRLVAYSDASGTVLQAVDLTSYFGDTWLPADPDCGHRSDAPTVSYLGPNDSTERASVRLGYTLAWVQMMNNGLGLDSSTCLDLKPSAIAGASATGAIAVVVVGPEVSDLRVRSFDKDAEVELLVPERTLWRVAVARDLSANDLTRTEVIAYDGKGNEIGREYLNQPKSP